MKHYRKIWIENFGPIPKDEYGRSYEIHHINGDRKDNRLENLACVSIQDHYNIHLDQHDYGAAFRIAQRLKLDPEIKSKLMSLSNSNRVSNNNHPFLDPKLRKKAQKSVKKRIEKKIQGFQNKEVVEKAIKRKKELYTTEDLSKQVKEGWNKWKELNGDPKKRTLQGSVAGAKKTRGTKWYHKETGENLRTFPHDPRIVEEGWKKGRFNGKELSKRANLHKLKIKNKKDEK